VGRLLVISGIAHLILLFLVPMMPGLTRLHDVGFETYAIELVDLPSQPRVVEEAPPEEIEEPAPEPEVEEPAPEVEEPEPEPEPAIPEEPVRQKPAIKPPAPRPPRKSLEDRIKERLDAENETRPDEPASEAPPETREAAQVSRATVATSRPVSGWYLSVVQGKVSSNWKRPSARLLTDEVLTVVVSFRIRRNGTIEGVTIRRSSGRPTIDQSAAKAVRDSEPFPSLADIIPDDHLDVTIDFTVTRD